MRVLAVCVVAFFALPVAASAPSWAQSPPPPPAEDAPPAKTESPKEQICVDRNPVANTRMNSQRVCRTREEWEKRGGVPK